MLVCKGYCTLVEKTVLLDIFYKCGLIMSKTIFEARDSNEMRRRKLEPWNKVASWIIMY